MGRIGVRIAPALPLIEADLLHCATSETFMHLDDFLRWRLPLPMLVKLIEADIRWICKKVSVVLNWNNSRIQEEIARRKKWLHAQEF